MTAPLCYRNLPEEILDSEIQDLVREGKLDVLCFTSPSGVKSFSNLLRKNELKLPPHTLIGSIGPTTGSSARDILGRSEIEPVTHTLEGLAGAVIAHFKTFNGD